MNKVVLIGRLTRDCEVYKTSESTVAKYSLAVERKFNREQQQADFINCVAFGKSGEFAEKYLRKGMKIAVVGRLQTGQYKNKDGQTIYTTDVVVEEHEFCESKQADGNTQQTPPPTPKAEFDGFMNIADGVDEELPFD
jgi:single-strand DNA-binding protein